MAEWKGVQGVEGMEKGWERMRGGEVCDDEEYVKVGRIGRGAVKGLGMEVKGVHTVRV